jgi:hypothetical protein
VRLICASGGDPIVNYSITNAPDHGSLQTTNLSSGLVGYTSNAGYSGADFFQFRATSTCGAASCQSSDATYDLTVLNPQQGPQGDPGTDGQQGSPGTPGTDGAQGPAGQAGATGPAGSVGPAGTAGADGSVVARDRLLIASFLDAFTARRGKPVTLRYVATTPATVVLEVFRGRQRVAAVNGSAVAGRNAIRWNGKVGRTRAKPGLYRLVLSATAGDQVTSDKATVRIVR